MTCFHTFMHLCRHFYPKQSCILFLSICFLLNAWTWHGKNHAPPNELQERWIIHTVIAQSQQTGCLKCLSLVILFALIFIFPVFLEGKFQSRIRNAYWEGVWCFSKCNRHLFLSNSISWQLWSVARCGKSDLWLFQRDPRYGCAVSSRLCICLWVCNPKSNFDINIRISYVAQCT